MRTATGISELAVGEVAMQYPAAIEIFNRYHIDYCCGGNHTLQEACDGAGQSVEEVWMEIHAEDNHSAVTRDFTSWSPGLLIDYIQEHHHTYVKKSIPLLQDLLKQIDFVHGKAHPELHPILVKFDLLAQELLLHLAKEEEVLFPAIRRAQNQGPKISINQPLIVMKEEHEFAGTLIKAIRTLSDNYKVPNGVCNTYRATYSKLKAFDDDLMMHIHLENNILYEKVKLN